MRPYTDEKFDSVRGGPSAQPQLTATWSVTESQSAMTESFAGGGYRAVPLASTREFILGECEAVVIVGARLRAAVELPQGAQVQAGLEVGG